MTAAVVLGLACWLPPAQADVQSVYQEAYSEPGFHDKWRQQVSTGSDNVDPFGGSLSLSNVDLVVPGNNGLDIVVHRNYSSNIWLSRSNPFSIPPYPTLLLPSGPVGVGWTMGFGRVVKSAHNDGLPDGICDTNASVAGDTTLDNAVLELPDGSQQVLAVSATGIALFITKNHWAANCYNAGEGLVVYAPNGLRYIMSHQVASFDEVTYSANLNRAWYPTRIEDGNGNALTISYLGRKGSYALIDEILSSDGRSVKFGYLNGYLDTITANSQTWKYEYLDVPGAVGHKLLARVVRPDGQAWQYEYFPGTGAAGGHAMKTVTYPYGATTSYTYGYVDFTGNVALMGGDPMQKYLGVVVATKTQGGRDIAPGTWVYDYAPGTDTGIEPGLHNDVTTVTFPGGRYVYRHYGMQRQLGIVSDVTPRHLWKTGLLKEKETWTESGAGQYVLLDKEVYEWDAPQVIS